MGKSTINGNFPLQCLFTRGYRRSSVSLLPRTARGSWTLQWTHGLLQETNTSRARPASLDLPSHQWTYTQGSKNWSPAALRPFSNPQAKVLKDQAQRLQAQLAVGFLIWKYLKHSEFGWNSWDFDGGWQTNAGSVGCLLFFRVLWFQGLCLVGGLEHVLFFHILEIIIPTD